eukprot:COSAG04_NODE_689_length_11142_cov_6.664041_5_plen_160_part_00
MAYKFGAAISVIGSAASTLVVDSSIFEANTVPATDAAVDVTVRVNTGAFAIGGQIGAEIAQVFVPIWRIDDGPVHGIPWELCQGALQRSQEGVRRGFEPSWPDLTCANVTYTGPDALYSSVVSLSGGAHTLWAGLLVMVRKQHSYVDKFSPTIHSRLRC